MSNANYRGQITGHHHKDRKRNPPAEFRFSGDYWLAVCHYLDRTLPGTPEAERAIGVIVHGQEAPRFNGRKQ